MRQKEVSCGVKVEEECPLVYINGVLVGSSKKGFKGYPKRWIPSAHDRLEP